MTEMRAKSAASSVFISMVKKVDVIALCAEGWMPSWVSRSFTGSTCFKNPYAVAQWVHDAHISLSCLGP